MITTFNDLRLEVFRLHGEQAFPQALELIEREGALFPEEAATLYFWRACFHSLLNEPDTAIKALAEAVERGYWYGEPQLRRDPDLTPLLGLPEFERLAGICAERQAQAQAEAKPLRLVVEPDAEAARPYPLLLALHGYNSSAVDHLDNWRPAAEQGWLVAALQSAQVAGINRFHWSDYDQARREIREHMAELSREYPLDTERIVIGGFSQGGATAIALTLDPTMPFKGCIGVAAGISEQWLATVETGRKRDVRAYFIIGDQDVRFYQPTLTLAKHLREQGISSQVKDYPGMGHVYPPDFASVLVEALTFITAG